MSKETGGPAFPFQHVKKRNGMGGICDWKNHLGMTLRDYFAAHAPAEPQPWFEPVTPPRPEAIGPVVDGWPANYQAIEFWEKEYRKQRYIQWPYAWADAQIEERER